MAEETKQSEPSVAVTADAKETPEAAVTEEENDDASDAPKKQAQNVAEGRNDNAADDSSSASGTAKEIPETVVEEDLYDDDDEDSAGQDRGDVDELEDTPSVGKGGGSGDDMDDGEEEDEEEEEEEEEGGIAPVLGEEERLVSIPGPRLRRQASAVGEFDYNVIGNRASDRFKHCVRRIESDPWDTDAWQVLVAEAQHGRGGGMGYREVLREFLKQFPASGRYRRMLAQAEMESGDWQTADKVMQEGLEICASLELWLFYLERARRSGTGAGSKDHASKADIIAAFELALQHVGPVFRMTERHYPLGQPEGGLNIAQAYLKNNYELERGKYVSVIL